MTLVYQKLKWIKEVLTLLFSVFVTVYFFGSLLITAFECYQNDMSQAILLSAVRIQMTVTSIVETGLATDFLPEFMKCILNRRFAVRV